MSRNSRTALCLIAVAALTTGAAALPVQATVSSPTASRSESTTVVASVTAGINHSHPECNSEHFTSLTVTQGLAVTSQHLQVRGSDYFDCRSGGAEDTVVVDEDLQADEFVISRNLRRAVLDADVTFEIFRYPDEPFTAQGHLTVLWTAKGAKTVERVTIRTREGWTRTTTVERPAKVSSLGTDQFLPGVWGDQLDEAQVTAFLRTTKIKRR